MLLKLLLSVTIVLSSTMIGMIYSSRYTIRPAQLREFQMIIQMLEIEIIYRYSPLPEALKKIARAVRGEIQKIILYAAELMDNRKGYTVSDIWAEAIGHYKQNLSLNDDDIYILLDLGKTMGSSDVDNQVKFFRWVLEQLKYQEKQAEEFKEKNQRLYRNLGILGGLAIAILLL